MFRKDDRALFRLCGGLAGGWWGARPGSSSVGASFSVTELSGCFSEVLPLEQPGVGWVLFEEGCFHLKMPCGDPGVLCVITLATSLLA